MDKINLNLYGLNFQKQVEKKEEEKIILNPNRSLELQFENKIKIWR